MYIYIILNNIISIYLCTYLFLDIYIYIYMFILNSIISIYLCIIMYLCIIYIYIYPK